MVAIFTGAGTGFERGSGNVLGGSGLLGSASLGRSGEQVMLNAATGNLLITQQDEFLIGRGPDAAIGRTYNSLGDLSDDNGDNWRQSTQRRIQDLTGTVNAAGSTVKRRGGDGALVTYGWNGSAYVATDGAGAYDRITYDGTWRWTDGDTQVVEVYGGPSNQITRMTDTSGNAISYGYTADKLTSITTANGEQIVYQWTGNNLTGVVARVLGSDSQFRNVTRTRYGYDGFGRLGSVSVDLTPDDNSVADGKVYTTTYSYHGSSKLVASISQTDGSHLAITYDGSNRVKSLIQTVASGVTRTTSIAYEVGSTTITDPQNQVVRLAYDGTGQLVEIVTPAPATGQPASIVYFNYNANGDLVRVRDQAGAVTGYGYDARGNMIEKLAPDGTVTVRTYSAANQVLTETIDANRIRNASMQAGAVGWQLGWNPHNIAVPPHEAGQVNGVTFVRGRFAATAAGQILSLTTGGNDLFQVTGGERLAVQTGIESQGPVDRVNLSIHFYDAAGVYTGSVDVQAVHGPRGFNTKIGGFVTVPAGSVRGRLELYVHSSGAGAGSFSMIEPTVTAASPSQLGFPAFSSIRGGAATATTRYAYDAAHRLRFVVDAEGGVTEFALDAFGQQNAVGRFADVRYAVAGWQPGRALDYNQMVGWRQGADKRSVHLTSTPLDARGNALEELAYGATGTAGEGGLQAGYTSRFTSYDQTGRLLSRRIVGENAESFVYDGLGRVTASTDTGGAITRIAFNDANAQTVVTLASGSVQTSTYNKAGELVAETDGGAHAGEASRSYRYDSLGRLRASTNASSHDSYHLYDRIGRKVADVSHDGRMAEYRYDAAGRLVATVRYATAIGASQIAQAANVAASPEVAALRPAGDAQDIWAWSVYDADGSVVQTIEGDGATTVYEHDAFDRVVRTTVFENKLTVAQINGFKTATPVVRVVPAVHAEDSVVRTFYDCVGLMVGSLDGEGRFTRIAYDALGEKVQETHFVNAAAAHLRADGTFDQLVAGVTAHANDSISRYVYDNQGHLRFAIDGLHRVIEYGYQYEGQAWFAYGPVRQVTRYAGSISALGTYTFDSVRQAITQAGLAGGANRTDHSVYDNAGRLIYSSSAEGEIVGYRYDLSGRLVRKIAFVDRRPTSTLPTPHDLDTWSSSAIGNAKNRVTRYYHNARGELRFTVDPEGYATVTNYDGEGRHTYTGIAQTKISAGDATTIDTIAATIDYSALVATYYEYDVAGQLFRVTDAKGTARELTYLANGLLLWDVAGAGTADESRTHHRYDAAGRESVRTEAHGTAYQRATSFGYDSRGNLTSISDAKLQATTRDYDRAG